MKANENRMLPPALRATPLPEGGSGRALSAALEKAPSGRGLPSEARLGENAPPPLAPLRAYNPDVLSCIANLSNDEVFTPPDLANRMLDLLPQELFSDPATTFLDPACKSGVFLREIAKRLIRGLAPRIPDLQKRLDHIFRKQLFGLAITELTSLLSRRSVYCSKYPNGKYSVVLFPDEQGNVRFGRVEHDWENGHCRYCGASQAQWGPEKRAKLETHAYSFIHTKRPEDLFKMKFDVIISNPPYQLNDGGNAASASPIYQYFVETAKKLNPRYLTMIIPTRWVAGGKGLSSFRDSMFSDEHISHLVDYQNGKDCFPGTSVGSVCYFLWDRGHSGPCTITNVIAGNEITATRRFDEFPVFVRYNQAISIMRKVHNTPRRSMTELVSFRNPFGFPTNIRGREKPKKDDVRLVASDGDSFISRRDVAQGQEWIDKYKVAVGRVTSEHANEPDKNGQFKVLSSTRILSPGEVCTDTYLVVGANKSKKQVENIQQYLSGRFVRFLLLQTLSSINLPREKYEIVPMQDFSKPWTDAELYRKYKLDKNEIAFIESMIKPME